jgi:rhamnosyl/mannosyltransferase
MPLSLSFPFLLRKFSKDKDILHFHEPFPLGVISYLLTKPKGKLVVWWHSDIIRQKKILYLYKPFILQFLKRADRIIVATAEHIESSAFLKAFKHKCEIIPFGIDVKRFQLTSNIQQEIDKIREKHGSKIILFVGRLSYYKGIEYLIRAMKNVAGKLLLIGQGPLGNKLREIVAEIHLENKVVFLGKLDDQEIIPYYHSCDIFVLPSVANSEAFGIVQLEAMACGKPVVNTAIPTGVPQVSINGKTGITVPPKDTDSLAMAINTLLDNENLRERYGREALIRVQNCFTMEKMIEKVYRTYKTL